VKDEAFIDCLENNSMVRAGKNAGILSDEHAAVPGHPQCECTIHNGLIIRQISAVKYVGRQAALLFELVCRCSSGDVVSQIPHLCVCREAFLVV
jgi:hypothetical protein